MDEYLAISIASVWMTAAFGFGVLLWIKRKDLFAPVFEHELTGQTTQDHKTL